MFTEGNKIDFFRHLYNGLLRFSPLKKRFKYLPDKEGAFPSVGFLDARLKRELENVLGVKIKRTEIFEQALLHRSYLQVLDDKRYFSNERLEFLGDSVLGMIVAEYLFSMQSFVLEGELTKMRSWLVNTNSLAVCARKIELDEFIKLSFGAEKAMENGSESILADALEAIIAAIYLDSGIETAKEFIIDTLLPLEMSSSLLKDRNYKSILLEKVQAAGKSSPVYEVINEEGPDHEKTFTVGVYVDEELVAIGDGKNKKQAEQNAAKRALEK